MDSPPNATESQTIDLASSSSEEFQETPTEPAVKSKEKPSEDSDDLFKCTAFDDFQRSKDASNYNIK